MKKVPAFFAFLLVLNLVQAQSVKDLNKTAKKQTTQSSSSGNSASSGSSYSGSAGDFFMAELLVRSFFWMGHGFVQLGREEARLARLNKQRNHLFCLDVRPQAGYGATGFIRLQPQVRANIGWFSLDLRQTILQDAGDEFKTLGFMFWANFWNREMFRFRGGLGTQHLYTTSQTHLQYGLGADFLPTPKVRFELEAWQTQKPYGSEIRPLRELLFRVHYAFWTKGILQASIFGGASSQMYFSKLDFTSVDAGLNFRLSASKYSSDQSLPTPIMP